MKQYTKPEVKKVEIDGDVMRMLTKQGFIDLFWERLQEARKELPETTQESIFDILNEKYFNAIGCMRYSCYESFRQVRDRK